MGTFFLLFLLFQTHHSTDHSFEDAERWAREFENPERDAWQKPDEVVEALSLEPGARVADIGVGSGYFARRFAKAVGNNGVVYAIDIEPNMLRYLAGRAQKEGQNNIVPVLATPDNPMLAPRSVDVIFICDTIHHVEQRQRYYEILHRNLDEDGRLVIVDFAKRDDVPVGPPLEMRIAKSDLLREVTAAGFRLEEEKTFLPHQYFLIFGRD
jgi:ubiquinone/menaquinone biosynthesis C-methylase UbiE